MEWKSNLRRAQSMSFVSSWDKTRSVSQLVARYQSTADLRSSVQETLVNDGEPKPDLKEISPSLQESKRPHLESLMWRNEEREWSRAKTSLVRSKSMESLRNSPASIEVLKALFESKEAMQNKAPSGFRAANFPSAYKAAETMQAVKGEADVVKRPAENKKIQTPADASVNDGKDDHLSQKVAEQTRMERRKTIGAIDFERFTASQDDEKRRSIADFRDNSCLQTKEKLCVSVKAISALYLSKVATQESKDRLFKPVRDQSSESGKRIKPTKMAEDPNQRKGDLPPQTSFRHQPGPNNTSGTHFQQSMPSQLSREKLYQQRQRSELRRLLKHTHPELTSLDDVVDEELSEVLSSETGPTTSETGYEGDVLSRCLIFENFDKVSPYTANEHMAEGTVERSDVNATTAVFKEREKRQCTERVKEIMEDGEILPNKECEEEMMRIDVQATRKIFESRSVNTYRQHPKDKFQGSVTMSGDEIVGGQNQNQEFRKGNLPCENNSKTCAKSLHMTDLPHKQEPCAHVLHQSPDNVFSDMEDAHRGETDFEDGVTSHPDSERSVEIIKTRAALFQNSPFIPTNIEREQSFEHSLKSLSTAGNSGKAQDHLEAIVKNRAHLFESMPFDQIRHQNRDEVETMVENMEETLHSLYNVHTIHSGGSIIEVNETMIAKKAKFTLSEGGPKIQYEEVAEGGAQNFILQLLPRANLKPQITYLKEDAKGGIKATVVHVPVNQHMFSMNQNTEFRTANVIQVVEDILNQDNSLRKGVIIQEDVNQCAEVLVYSLYNYFDVEDVKSYCPPQNSECDEPQPKKDYVSETDNEQLRKGAVESTISCLLETSKNQTYQGSMQPEITVKGNVKLFKSCIEKGDLEYLKNLQAEPTMQNLAGKGLDLHQEEKGDQTEENMTEWVPVDVKKLKNIFSGGRGPTQPKQHACENRAQFNTISAAIQDQNVPLRKSGSSTECNNGVFSNEQPRETLLESVAQTQDGSCNSATVPQLSNLHLETQNDDRVHKAELVEAVDVNDEIINLQTAIHNLRQATVEAKSLDHLSQEKYSLRLSSNEPYVSVTTGNVKYSRTEAKLPQENEDQKDNPCIKPRWDELPTSAFNITSQHKSDHQHENSKTCHQDTNSEETEINEAKNETGQKGTKVALKSVMASGHSSEITAAQQKDEEVVFQGKLQAALNSLEKSNINVTRGDFRAAMIYRHSSKPHNERPQNVDVAVQKPTKEKLCPLTEIKSNQAIPRQEVSNVNADPQSQIVILNKDTDAVLKTNKRPVGPKPAIPPKPEHLKEAHRDSQSTNAKIPKLTQADMVKFKETVPQPLQMTTLSPRDEHKPEVFKAYSNVNSVPDSVDLDEDQVMSQENEARLQVPGSVFTFETDNTDKIMINRQQEIHVKVDEKSPQNFSVIEDMKQTDDHVDFHDECLKLGGKKVISKENAPVKPKRVRIAQPDNKNTKHMCGDCGDNNSSILTHVFEQPQETVTGPSHNEPNTCGQNTDGKDKHRKAEKQESKVEMREKRGPIETENERRQRLSVHMDEIMRGNMTTAMEIFDNLRKQEELQSILSKVEEIEQDTRKVDVRSLRGVFENVPDWVVNSDKKKQKRFKIENKEEKMQLVRDKTEGKSSMAHVFGDLERASEEIMNLKEQTLARLLDIEGAIKKALYSVSALKSDSDIDGLSYLFKESLGTAQASPSSGNISKISIGSCRIKSVSERPPALPVSQGASIEVASAKQLVTPPSSPAFISIQSAARKTVKTEVLPAETKLCPTCQHSPKMEEKFRTTKTLRCSSPAQNRNIDPRHGSQEQFCFNQLNPKRELSALGVETEGNGVMDTKTVTENYERTDSIGNRFYSSTTSTVISAHPETTTSTGQPLVSPATYQVTKYPEVHLPINQKP